MKLSLTPPIPGMKVYRPCADCGHVTVPEGQGRPWNVCVHCGQTGPLDPGLPARLVRYS